MFSVGILYSAQEFLSFVQTNPNIGLGFKNMFNTFSVASPIAILDVSQKCEWIKLNVSGFLEVTEKGKLILEKDSEAALRTQIGHLIESSTPAWIPLLSRGRSEAGKYLPLDVKQCFREAGLFESISDEIVNWWDKYSKISRKVNKDNNLEIGRKGEKLSIAYERNRTSREPIWQSIESNLSGFDILSTIDDKNTSHLRIEVKTANSDLKSAVFFLSKNEWDVAITSSNYVFHLWSLQPKPTLKVVSVNDVRGNVPDNNGDGLWQKVSIPFTAFQ